jgi:hypothetical protein
MVLVQIKIPDFAPGIQCHIGIEVGFERPRERQNAQKRFRISRIRHFQSRRSRYPASGKSHFPLELLFGVVFRELFCEQTESIASAISL